MYYLYLILFSIKIQHHIIYVLFIHIFGSIFPFLITEGCDGRRRSGGDWTINNNLSISVYENHNHAVTVCYSCNYSVLLLQLPCATPATTVCYSCNLLYGLRSSSESGRDNPFRPDGDISREADEIVQLIKSGKPLLESPSVGGDSPASFTLNSTSPDGGAQLQHSPVREQQAQKATGS